MLDPSVKLRPRVLWRSPFLWAAVLVAACVAAAVALTLYYTVPADTGKYAISADGVYDVSAPCSSAAEAWQACGSNGKVCGYGLACVATAEGGAACFPICQAAWRADEPAQSNVVLDQYNAGCVVDDETDTSADVGAINVSVRGVAVPGCDVAAPNLAADDVGDIDFRIPDPTLTDARSPPPLHADPGYACNVSQPGLSVEYCCGMPARDGALLPGASYFTCEALVSNNGTYDASVPCDEAAQAWEECGSNGRACGYGLACVASHLLFASCVPVCGEDWSEPARYPARYAAGCTTSLRTHRGKINRENHVNVGNVEIDWDGIARPVCPGRTNIAHNSTGHVVTNRTKLAGDMIALNMVFMEAQRYGSSPGDGIMSMVWEWKGDAFLNPCSTLFNKFNTSNQRLTEHIGFADGGTAVLFTGHQAFTIAQQAIATIVYGDVVAATTTTGVKAPCTSPGLQNATNVELLERHFQYSANMLLATVVRRGPPADFVQITGISNQDSFLWQGPSWQLDEVGFGWVQDRCFYSDLESAAADVAAQTAAALALLSIVIEKDEVLAVEALEVAKEAFWYAREVYRKFPESARCKDRARYTCSGACDPTSPAPCAYLYSTDDWDEGSENLGSPKQQLYAAAAALHLATRSKLFLKEASELAQFRLTALSSWDRVWAQGAMIMSVANVPGYADDLAMGVKIWSDCVRYGTSKECELTPDGYAYPLAMPWGNMGASLNAVCMAGLVLKYGAAHDKQDVACFIEQQLGYIANHKCHRKGELCNTGTPGGFSYIIGYNDAYPKQPHSRDAGYPNWGTSQPNGQTLCGGVVSGPNETPVGSFVDWRSSVATDYYRDVRDHFESTEAGFDYAAAAVCAFAAYASLPSKAFDACSARTPLTRDASLAAAQPVGFV